MKDKVRNETWYLTNNEIEVTVQSSLWVPGELMAW